MRLSKIFLGLVLASGLLMPLFACASSMGLPPNNLGLVGYWTFDGKNLINNVADSSGNTNTGDLVGFTSTTTAMGKIGQALAFNGTSQYVTIPDSTSLHVGTITVSTWFYLTSTPSGNGAIVTKPLNGPPWSAPYLSWLLRINSLTQLEDDVGNGSTYSAGAGCPSFSVSSIALNTWHHLVMTYDGTNINSYLDGKNVQNCNYVGGAISYTSSPLIIAASYAASPAGDYFPGYIDDVRVYNRVLTAVQATQLYNAGRSTVSASQPTLLSNGLVGYWTFDGKNLINNVIDSSGAGVTGDLGGSTSTTTIRGEIGQALSFDGSSNHVVFPGNTPLSSDASSMSVALWFKSTSNGVIFSDSNTDVSGTPTGFDPLIYIETNGILHAGGWIGSAPNLASSGAVNDGKWHQAVWVNSGGSIQSLYLDGQFVTSVSGGMFGVSSTNIWQIGTGYVGNTAQWPNTPNNWFYYNGAVDDVRVYNRALSANEIQELYNSAGDVQSTSQPGLVSNGLVGYWTFDGKNLNNNVTDSSATSDNGNLVNFTSTTTLVGKVGQALTFDGANNYVSVPFNSAFQLAHNFTLAAWINPTLSNDGNFHFIVGQVTFTDTTDSNSTYKLYIDIDGTIGLYNLAGGAFAIQGTAVVPANKWTHVVATSDGATVNIYVNGVLDKSLSYSTSFAHGSSNDNIQMGQNLSTAAQPFKGAIDDVRIYNRALSQTEITELYNQGK